MKHRGFTLVELLIVIAILGILIGLLVPSIGKAMEMARSTSCKNNLRAISVGLRMYLDQSNDVMPIAAILPSAKLNNDPRIVDVLASHVGNTLAFKCPSDRVENFFASEGSSYEYNSMLGGQQVSKSFLTRRVGEEHTFVLHDYKPFHGIPGALGAANYLFADGHVGDLD